MRQLFIIHSGIRNMREDNAILIIIFFAHICLSAAQQVTKWDSLKVKWGPKPELPGVFAELPMTEAKALADGFIKINECAAHYPWKGNGYTKNGDGALLLLYDAKGYIAGIQAQIPKNLPNGFPSTYQQPPFVNDGNFWTITVYFTDPSKICTKGRSAKAFETQGIGSKLYIQNGTRPEDSIIVPRKESGLMNTGWKKGLCFPMMGTHYWWNLSEDMGCDKAFPIFLMYNKKQLTGFGWAFIADLSSPRYEHPPSNVYKMFMKPVPKCLLAAGVTTTLHIYLTSQPQTIAC